MRIRNLFLTALLGLVSCIPSYAQNPTQNFSSGVITSTSGSCTLSNTTGCVVLPLPNSNRSFAVITVSGVFTGPLYFITTNAGLPFSGSLSMTPVAGGVPVTSASASGSWTAIIAGQTVVGVASGITSGSATVTITSSTAPAGGSSGTGGGISGLTAGFLPKATSATSLGNSLCDEGITTPNVFTCTDSAGAAFTGGMSVTADGAHPTNILGVGNTTLPALGSNQFGLFWPPATSFTSWSAQFGTAIIPNNHALICVVTGTNCLISDGGVLGTLAFPVTVTSGVSGAIPCFTSTTALSSGALLASGGVVLGGGAGACPLTNTALTFSGSTLQVGLATSSTGIISLGGGTSGNSTITGPAVAGTTTNPITLSNVINVADGNSTHAGLGFSSNAGTGIYYNGGTPIFIVNSGAAAAFGSGSLQYVTQLAPSVTNHAFLHSTATTIAGAGCGGSAATIATSNGANAFTINTGTSPLTACTVTLPSATTGWICNANDLTTASTSVFLQKQTGAASQTSVTITNFNTAGTATNFVGSDIVRVACFGY